MTNMYRAAEIIERATRGAHTTDGHATFNGHPITEWVRHHERNTTMTHDDWPTSELAREWTHRGLTCRVYSLARGDGSFRHNGYVELPAGHPARHLDLQWDDCEVFDVHGGITYGGEGSRVIGWDTVHAGDMSWFFPRGRVWTVDDVEDETTRLANQVADLYTPEAVAMHKAATQLRELADELDPTKKEPA